jgi:chromosome segregation ATPase
MWPRILLELLPHFSRLLPVADKYLNSRNVSDKERETALAALAEEVRGELGQVTEEHAGLRRRLQEQTEQLAQVSVDVARARMAVESVEERLAKLERTAALSLRLLSAALGLLAIAVAILIIRKH